MKYVLTALAVFAFSLMPILSGCAPEKSAEEKVAKALKEQQYALTADERKRANTNASNYFEKEWVISEKRRGQVTMCRPSDSNTNGYVTCFGITPAPGPVGFNQESQVFCSYRPELVGCTDKEPQ